MTGREIAHLVFAGQVSLTEFDTATQDYEFGIVRSQSGDVCGVVMLRGPEIHVGLLPDHRKRHIFRRELAHHLGQLIQQYGYAVTKVRHEGDHDFVTRMGFKETGFDMFNVYYTLTENRYARHP